MPGIEEGWLTAHQLQALAHNEGFSDVSLRQIERWRKARLLPRPRRVSLGRGKGMRFSSVTLNWQCSMKSSIKN